MRLKSIKLAGFKSFVDPTTVHFPSNMSAVVGPNGCGKSNIIDAVRWVMGESSAKNLRGESMTDVIFNGSNARKPVGQASIELIFDNTDKTLTGEYAAFNEISIRRKVTRENESSYFLNGTKCRRRDITDIFLGTGLGPRSYAIIEQGMISKLIEAKPEELRVYIEEAAGISRYKERRRDTENRIRRTRENLERLTDIRDELERQLQHLNRQAKTAERYKVLKQQERDNTALLQAIQWHDLATTKALGEATIAEKQIVLESALADKVKAESTIEKQRLNLTEQNDEFNQIQAQFYSLGADIARDEQRINNIQERELQLTRDLEQAQSALFEAQQHINTDKEALAQAEQELLEIAPELEAAQEIEEALLDQLEQAQQSMQDWQTTWDDFNSGASEIKQQAEVEQSRIQYVEQSIQRLSERHTKLKEESVHLEQEAFISDLHELESTLELTREQLASNNEHLLETAESISQARASVSEVNTELSQKNAILQQSKGRLSALDALQQDAISQGDDAEAWLNENNLANAKRLADELTVDNDWDTAVETVLADFLQSVAIEDLNTYFIDSTMPAAGTTLFEPDYSHTDINASSLATKVNTCSLTALLNNVLCADSVDDALNKRASLKPAQSLITKEGVWFGANWVRMLNQQDSDQSVLRRQAEIIALQDDISESEDIISELDIHKSTVQQRLSSLENAQTDKQRNVAELNKQFTQQSSQVSSLQAKQERLMSRAEQLTHEIEQIQEQQSSELETLGEHRLRLEVALENMAEQTEKREELLHERDTKRDLLDSARDNARQQKDQLMALSIRHQSLKTQVDSVQQTSERMLQQLDLLEERTEILSMQHETNSEPLEDLKITLEENLQQRVEVEMQLSAAREQITVIENDMRALEMTRNQSESKAQDIRTLLEQARLSVQTLLVQQTNLEQLLKESEYVLDDLLQTEDMPSETELKDSLTRLSASIARLGAINLAAIDEYEQQSERKHYLDAQNEDLLAALDTLENAIRKIDRETRSRFKETFDEVNAGLGELFPQVFGGGQAYLELTGDDLLDTGIAIMARPPGKKNSTIHLLSGGEKALTAIALVFAIFKLNPAPFCMLDEVDAPLDDANVGRYAKIVKSMSSQVQFIYITHNKIPMEFADHLMGVTMHEPGVSRLVTVDVDKAAQLAAV